MELTTVLRRIIIFSSTLICNIQANVFNTNLCLFDELNHEQSCTQSPQPPLSVVGHLVTKYIIYWLYQVLLFSFFLVGKGGGGGGWVQFGCTPFLHLPFQLKFQYTTNSILQHSVREPALHSGSELLYILTLFNVML